MTTAKFRHILQIYHKVIALEARNTFDTAEFRAALARKGYTQKRLAKEIGMSEHTMVRKIKLGIFGTNEVAKILSVLDIHNPGPIFFAPEVNCEDANVRRDA